MTPVTVSLLPAFAENISLSGQSAVVIDILRASTTIVHALANGANSVIPSATVKQAFKLAETIPQEGRLLGGERHCQRVEGFDLGNSPLEYHAEVVADRDVVFTSTNGTYALQTCLAAEKIRFGAFVNLSALVHELCADRLPVHLVCAGTNRLMTAEDILFAGAVVDALVKAGTSPFGVTGVECQLALDFYRSRGTTEKGRRQTVFDSLGAENLLRLGMQADIERAVQLDLFDVVPIWHQETERLISSDSN